jgi:hypothetical protein
MGGFKQRPAREIQEVPIDLDGRRNGRNEGSKGRSGGRSDDNGAFGLCTSISEASIQAVAET